MNQEMMMPIAHGRTAEVYLWEPGSVLKLYFSWCPTAWIEQERRAACAVLKAGIATPLASEIVEINGRYGLVFERIEGISMLKDLNRRPWCLIKNARTLARLQVQVNQLKVPGLPSYSRSLERTIRRSPHIPKSLIKQALSLLEKLPDGDFVCHGDFHPGNILLTAKGPMVIDWMTVSTGDPWADVARTSVILQVGIKGAGKMVSPILSLANKTYYQAYLKHYCHLYPNYQNRLEYWIPVLAAARLNENIAPERQDLLRLAERGEKYV